VRVLFTDFSYPSPGGTIVRWEWDFDNDGNVELTWTPYSGDVLLWTWDRDDDGTSDEFQLDVKHTFEWLYENPGTYSVRLTVTEDLGGSDTEIKVNYVTVTPAPVVSMASSVDSWVVFVDDLPIDLIADTTGTDCDIVTYQWRQHGSPVGGNSPTLTIPDSTLPGEYHFTIVVTCTSNCKDAAEATVVVLGACQPFAPDFGVCQGATLNNALFIRNGAVCYNAAGVPAFQLVYSFNTSAPGQYEYTVICTDCPDKSTVGIVTVYSLPIANAGTDRLINPGDSLHIGGIPTATGGTPFDEAPQYRYSWTPTRGLNDPSVANPVARPSSTTTYTVMVTDSHGCTDIDSVTIAVRTPPTTTGGGGGVDLAGEPTCFFDVDMLGEVTRIYVTCQDGRCIGNYEPDDPSDKNYLEFNGGTRVTYNLEGEFNGGPPRWVRMREMDSPPPTSEGQVAVTPVYSFIGYTATGLPTDSVFFDAAVGMQLDYDPDALPENTTGVGIAGWNEDTYQWEFLPQATGRVAGVGTATGDVMHFSTFAVLATTGEAVSAAPAAVATPAAPAGSRPATFAGSNLQIEPAVERLWGPLTFITRTGNSVTITAIVENVGNESGIYVAELMLNGKVVGSQDVSLAGGEQKQVRFVVSRIAAGDYRVQIGELSGAFTSEREVTWWLIAVVIALAAGMAGWFALHQRRKKQIA
jgi:PKD repeat protein